MSDRRTFLVGSMALLASGCGGGGGNGSRSQPKEQFAPVQPNPTDWNVATPDSVGIPAAAIDKLLSDGSNVSSLRSLLVARDGKLIGERYYGGASAADLFQLKSVTKSVSSMLIGRALGNGQISGLQATLSQLIPEALASTPGATAGPISLAQVLTMCTGIEWVEESDDSWKRWNAAPDKTRFVLGLPTHPGIVWHYDSASSHLTSPILQRIHGINEHELAKRDLFQPLGISQSAWEKDSINVPYGSYGLQLRTRDSLKIGQMVLDGGKWNSKEVVPASWLAESLSARFKIGSFGPVNQLGYGYLWWSGIIGEKDVQFAWGHGGQFIIMVPSLRMVIASNNWAEVDFPTATKQELETLRMITPFLASLS